MIRVRQTDDGTNVYSAGAPSGEHFELRGRSGRAFYVAPRRALVGTCRECGARTRRGECLLCDVVQR